MRLNAYFSQSIVKSREKLRFIVAAASTPGEEGDRFRETRLGENGVRLLGVPFFAAPLAIQLKTANEPSLIGGIESAQCEEAPHLIVGTYRIRYICFLR
jgi:hypothetical protein